ncbi:MAG: PotD/PotF family extracellular solute-binding protein [Burkholderiaceae bacterium]
MANESAIRSERRRFLRHASVGSLSAAASVALLTPAAAQDIKGELKFGTWGGSWRDAFDKLAGAPIKSRGVSMDYVLGTPANNFARLLAARGRTAPIDAMESVPDLQPALISNRFIQPIDYAKVPNAAHLPSLSRGEFGAVTCAMMSGVVYNTVKFAELGLRPPAHITDLAHPKLAGRVAFPDITHSEHVNSIVALAYERGGNESTVLNTIKDINAIKPAFFYASSTDLAAKFSAGEVWAAPWHAGFSVRLKRTGVPAGFAQPDLGGKIGSINPILFHITAGTQNLAAAQALLNTYLEPEVQYEFTRIVGSVPMNPVARKRLMENPENRDVLLLTDEQLANALNVDYAKLDLQAWRDAWARQIKR